MTSTPDRDSLLAGGFPTQYVDVNPEETREWIESLDALVDALGPLADSGVIWLMTPKPGRPGHVEPEDIADAAPTSGLQSTSNISAATDWQGTRLVAPKSRR